jgi:hypothetical protein
VRPLRRARPVSQWFLTRRPLCATVATASGNRYATGSSCTKVCAAHAHSAVVRKRDSCSPLG